jgi:hypothetical protein
MLTEEVTKGNLELDGVVVLFAKSGDEGVDLGTAKGEEVSEIGEGEEERTYT